jgi:sialidase-1
MKSLPKTIVQRCSVLSIVLILFIGEVHAQSLNPLFVSGTNGYASYRIPAIVASKSGSLLAFAEGRKNGSGDNGDIDLVLKRSADGGETWSDMQVVWNDKDNTCGNPAPVVDQKTGRITLLSTWNLGADHEPQIINQTSKDTRRIYMMYSDDEGLSWSSPKEITSDVKKPDWTWYATGPCNGIQMESNKHRGRLIIPCDHIEAGSKKYFSHVVYSDNGGMNWKLGGTTPSDKVNESTVAEIPKGKLLLNMRNYTSTRIRQTSLSEDGGITWSELKGDTTLIEPVCQASMIAYKEKGSKPVLVFSNPADQKNRVNMTVRLSYDNGNTWIKKQVVHAGPAAYSNLVQLPGGGLAIFYEAGNKNPYEGIVFKVLDMNEFK